ncbi:hypothetical protein J0X19_10125 [Hymenobacter sp. BT186]|uniref:Macroglobulin domain-containing protein n=1 Tax=Hymenobacter telluris TaxID=2816474 RepID=A0A939JCF0_9BACT|nr:MG2 domain-containing protein [Hymenobacter telluris]MBO0358300.1 hypothetical protein [Hymenobacter telluris]MBW3374326.1 hypothetical protein [Hymenobacter norwichensis]
MASFTAKTTGRAACLGLLLTLGATTQVAAQAPSDSLGGLASRFGRYQRAALPEKLFLHLDRPLYTSGETMWFKVYAVEGTHAQPLALSKVAYVEVLDKENRAVLQAKVPLKDATGQGSFALPATLASGAYTVRAYTNWMKNFGPDYFFHSSITVLNTFTASGTVAGKDSATYEVQFFPEGGNLVQSLASKVAFKVTSRTGKGVAAEGKLLTQSGAVVASFKTLRLGMGSFSFTPEAGQTYTAVITPAKAPTIKRSLPRVFEQGYVMRLENSSPDTLTFTVSTTKAQSETLYLLGHARQQVLVTARTQTTNGRASFTVSKKQLLDGISHFTLFSADHKPLCERLYFQQPTGQLAIAARPDKGQYASRNKVSVQVATTGLGAQPLGANLSMAVYRLDSLTSSAAADINSYLWLTSDLRGRIENPEYYFTANAPDAEAAADNLMLTQGWSRFRWENILTDSATTFAYLPELNAPLLRARLMAPESKKPAGGVIAYLSAPSRIIRLNNARTDATGLAQFELDNFYGAQDVVLQTNPRQDSTSRFEILSPFTNQFGTFKPTLFSTNPRFQADYAKRHFQTQVQATYARSFKAPPLPKAVAVDSSAFYGKPDETYFLDKYTRFKVLEEVMREYVPGVVVRIRKDGFHFLVVDKTNKTILTENPMVLLDGVPVFNLNKMMAMDPLKIQKLEVIDSRYFHGWMMYEGLVSYTTYKGDLEGFPLDPRVLVQRYEGLQEHREFYAPRYDTPEARQSRLPDLRNLLYWNPNVTTTSTVPATLDFYTGDQAGRYIVVLQGLSQTGLAGSSSFTFEVKQAL